MNKQLEKRKDLQAFIDNLLIFFESVSVVEEEVDMNKVNTSIKNLNEIKDILSNPTSCMTFNEKLKFSQDFEEELLQNDIEEYLEGFTEEQFRDLFGIKNRSQKKIFKISSKNTKKSVLRSKMNQIFFIIPFII